MATSFAAESLRISAVWNASGHEQELKTWDQKGLTKLKSRESKEKDPHSGQVVQWKGALLSDLVDQALLELPPENKAQVDLIVLRGQHGEALVPRSIVVKYPVMLALTKEGQSLGGIQSVIPWTSRARILSEDLPLETYFVSGVYQVQLTNYRERYRALFLRRRTDPSAMRGEKLFVQNCISCHMEGHRVGTLNSRTIASSEHPQVRGALGAAPKINLRDRRYLTSYLDAYRSENPITNVVTEITQAAPQKALYLPRMR
jgi:hypothetical protein